MEILFDLIFRTETMLRYEATMLIINWLKFIFIGGDMTSVAVKHTSIIERME